VHAASGGDIDERGREARRERVQQVFGGVWALVVADQDGRLARVEDERLLARRVRR